MVGGSTVTWVASVREFSESVKIIVTVPDFLSSHVMDDEAPESETDTMEGSVDSHVADAGTSIIKPMELLNSAP